jgi:NAD(P)-dependent dehydrogenase (short-subunit alcohol dehydrogenase family)
MQQNEYFAYLSTGVGIPAAAPLTTTHYDLPMTLNFSDKIVLVTGGTGGLGRAVTLAFLNEGAKVIVTYRNPQELTSLEIAASAHSANLEGHNTDVTDENSIDQLIAEIIKKHGQLDTLVNTVGAYAGGIKLWDISPSTFDRMFALNVRSSYALARAAIPAMLKQGHGSIVNVAAKAAVDHAAGASAYAASKAAAVALMDSLAADLMGTGIRVNSILPNVIDTAVNRKAMPNADYSTWPKPEDLASVILFLSSDAAKVIHGATIPLYGTSTPIYGTS